MGSSRNGSTMASPHGCSLRRPLRTQTVLLLGMKMWGAVGLALAVACDWFGGPNELAWSSATAGEFETCGLSRTGEAWCWGSPDGYYGSPDPDSLPERSAVPRFVPGGHRFSSISSGSLPTCALDDNGAAYCWGSNLTGEVGDGSYLAKLGPAPVAGGYHWSHLAAGGSHVCAITTTHQAYCWGNQFRGALGNGLASGTSPTPTAVAGEIAFAAIAAGSGTTCALDLTGAAYCWGVGDNGLLGDSQPPKTGTESTVPVQVVGGLKFSSIVVGGTQVCAIAIDATAYCWGYGSELGNGTSGASSVPVPVAGGHFWSRLSAGVVHTCGVTLDGAVYCWGNGIYGAFGNGFTGVALSPVRVAEPGHFQKIVAGGYHTCGLTAKGIMWCWGRGTNGQLGDGQFENRMAPVQVGAR